MSRFGFTKVPNMWRQQLREAKARGATYHVAMVILEKARWAEWVTLSNGALGIDRGTKYDALKQLRAAGLILVEERKGTAFGGPKRKLFPPLRIDIASIFRTSAVLPIFASIDHALTYSLIASSAHIGGSTMSVPVSERALMQQINRRLHADAMIDRRGRRQCGPTVGRRR